MMSHMAERTAVLNIRMKPELRELIEAQAKAEDVAPSALARAILAGYFSQRASKR